YHIALQNDRDEVLAYARLLPTTSPYLLGQVFPELLNGLEPPASHQIWELSRFAAVDLSSAGASQPNQMSSCSAIELIDACHRIATRLGAEQLITVSPIGVERLLRAHGVSAHRAGPPKLIGGHAIFACWIHLTRQITGVVFERLGISDFSSSA